MLLLSFREYVDYICDQKDLNKKYSDYLEFSSFPYILDLEKDNKLIQEYLKGIFNTIVLKDVVSRNRITDVMMLESVIRFLLHNIGNISSTKKISDTMTIQGRKISTHTVESYIKNLMSSYIIYQARRYDIKGKQYLKTMVKYYVVDIGLRYNILGSAALDTGYILENIIYLELIRRGYNVYIGKVDNLEIDFIATNNNGLRSYQVAATVRDKSTLERELLPFKKIKDDYPKILLTLDNETETDYNGIIKKNALEFLLEDE